MIVRPASRMLSAISFGVFCRSAPSTSPIMRSRKVEPWRRGDPHLDPVGQHLRAAGDRRAVAARFADDRRRFAGDRRLVDRGDALDHLAVGGDDVAGLDQHDVADLQARCRARSCSSSGRCRSSSFACVSVRVRRSESACALPRPSATASAKLAKSTVNQSQRMIWNVEAEMLAADERSRRKMTVVSARRPRPRT